MDRRQMFAQRDVISTGLRVGRFLVLGLLAVFILFATLKHASNRTTSNASQETTTSEWFNSPTKVVDGLMYAYETRNDSLYAALLADDFRYYYEPAGADSLGVVGWGKQEEVMATRNLFRAPAVESLRFILKHGEAHPAGGADRDGWMVVSISGGEMVVSVKNKDPMEVPLNPQAIVVRPVTYDNSIRKWEIVEWHDYPEAP